VGATLYYSVSLVGKMRGIAFIQDPDGYWIEILSAKDMAANAV